MNNADAAASQPPAKEQLGTLLLRRGLITEEQLQTALAVQRETGAPLGQIVVERGFVRPSIVAQALATQHGSLLKTEYGYATTFNGQSPPAAPAPEADRVALLEAAVVVRDEAIASFNATAQSWKVALEQRDDMIRQLAAERDAAHAELAQARSEIAALRAGLPGDGSVAFRVADAAP